MKIFTPIKLSENINQTPEGYLLCSNVAVTRLGVLKYGPNETPIKVGDDGLVHIERTEEDVFDKNFMSSLEGKPLTIKHPKDFVDPQNWNDLSRGHMFNIRRGEGEESDLLLADILVTDATAIGLINGGLRDVSLGYDADYIETGKGKGRQTKMVGNHCALVEKGRAGEACAVIDHDTTSRKEETKMSKLKEQFLKMVGKTFDEEMKEDDKKEAKDEGAMALDELTKMVKDMGEKLDAMKPKDDSEEKPMPKKKDEEAKDDEEGEEGSNMESRLKALETSVAKIMEMLSDESADEDSDGDNDGDEAEDTDEEDETVDADNMGMTSDEAYSRAEILSPGIDKKAKNLKATAIKNFYATKEGKEVIEKINGKKAPTFDSAEKVDSILRAASELVKASRKGNLSKTKRVEDSAAYELGQDEFSGKKVSAADLNKKFAEHYSKKN